MINLFDDLNLLQHFLETSEDFVFIVRVEDAKLLFANATACKRLGYTSDELKAMEIFEWRQPLGDTESYKEHLEKLKKENAFRSYGILTCKDGSKFEVETNVKLVTHEGVDYNIAIARDISDWLASQRREKDLLEKLKQEHELKLQSLLLNSVTDSIFVHRHDGSFIYINEAAYKSLGYEKEELMHLKVQDLDYHDEKVGKEVYEDNMKIIMQQMQTKGEARFEVMHKGKNQRIIPIEVHSKVIRVMNEEYILSIARNISERIEQQRTLEKLATTDQLTGIFNRYMFEELFLKELERIKRYPFQLSLIMFDIDNFKNVNDTYGHDVGDVVLKDIVSLVKNSIRKSDVFTRWGGEEFFILCPNTEESHALTLAQKLRKEIETATFTGVGHLTCSFGLTSYVDADELDTFTKRADDALYKAKEKGRNQVVTL